MPWYKVSFSWDEIAAGKQRALQDAFATSFIRADGPKDAGMFASADIGDNTDYFSPRGVEIAKRLITQYGGIECPAPKRSQVLIRVARPGFEAIPFSPELRSGD